jgi:hypothetical protein
MQNRGYDDELLVVLDRVLQDGLSPLILKSSVKNGETGVVQMAARIAQRKVANNQLSLNDLDQLNTVPANRLRETIVADNLDQQESLIESLVVAFGRSPATGAVIAAELQSGGQDQTLLRVLLESLASHPANSFPLHAEWQTSLQKLIGSPNPQTQSAAIRAVRSVGASHFAAALRKLVILPLILLLRGLKP